MVAPRSGWRSGARRSTESRTQSRRESTAMLVTFHPHSLFVIKFGNRGTSMKNEHILMVVRRSFTMGFCKGANLQKLKAPVERDNAALIASKRRCRRHHHLAIIPSPKLQKRRNTGGVGGRLGSFSNSVLTCCPILPQYFAFTVIQPIVLLFNQHAIIRLSFFHGLACVSAVE
jgi:hypothetical protein